MPLVVKIILMASLLSITALAVAIVIAVTIYDAVSALSRMRKGESDAADNDPVHRGGLGGGDDNTPEDETKSGQ